MAETQMTMNRVIHAAVRRDFDRAEAALRAAPDGDRTRAGEIARAWDFLAAQLMHHHEQEDTLIWPALKGLGVDPVLLEEMESEHGAMHEALDATGAAVHHYRHSATRADAETAAETLAGARQVTERHLRHEEQELEPQLYPHLESAEWKAVERQLRKQPPSSAGSMFAWLLDGPDTTERRFLRQTVPAPVLLLFTKVFGRRYTREIAPVWR